MLDGQRAKAKAKQAHEDDNDLPILTSGSKKRVFKEEAQVKKTPNSATRFRVYPSKKQHELLQYWLKVTRFSYNEFVRQIRKKTAFTYRDGPLTFEEYQAEVERCKDATKKVLNIKYLRDTFITGINTARDVSDVHEKFRWLRDEANVQKYGLVPYDIIANAAITLLKNYASNFAKLKNTASSSKFFIRLKKWNTVTSMVVPNGKWKPYIKDQASVKGIFDKAYNDFRFEGNKPRPETIEYDSTLVYDPILGHYHLCIPRYIEKRSSVPLDNLKVISIDKIKNNNTMILNTKSKTKIAMLLRWKNRKGVLYPAWQVSLINR